MQVTCFSLIFVVALGAFAQAPDKPAPAAATTPVVSASAPATPAKPAAHTGLTIPVELKTTLKAEKAQVGDAVKFATLEPILVHKGLVMPEHAHLYGHVIGAAAKQGTNPSWISIVVDRAEWKDESLPLHAYIAGKFEPAATLKTGIEDASTTNPGNPTSVTHNANIDGHMTNLGDPRAAIRQARVNDEQTFNREPLRFSTGMEDVKLARHASGATLLVCEKHNLKLYSGTLFMLQDVPAKPPQAGAPPAQAGAATPTQTSK